MVQLLEAASLLLRRGFQPQRTLLLAIGHDEEVGGAAGGGGLGGSRHTECIGALPRVMTLELAAGPGSRRPGHSCCVLSPVPPLCRPTDATSAGAAAIAELLRSRGVELELVLDEGGSIMMDGLGKDAAVTITEDVSAGQRQMGPSCPAGCL